MKKRLFLLLFASSFAFSQSTETLFVTGNDFYKKGEIELAIEAYQKIELQGVVSSELYYNLGNCYYKLNNVAETIFNYEKALQLDPQNEDAANNLVFAKRLTIDRIEELPKSMLQKFNEQYLQKRTYNQWAMISCVLSFLTASFFLLFYFSFSSNKKRFFFSASIFSLLCFIASLSVTYNQYNFSKNEVYAILFSEKTEIKSEPTSSSENSFTLHEGTKVKILDTVDNWKKIKLADGQMGWILSDELKVFTLF